MKIGYVCIWAGKPEAVLEAQLRNLKASGVEQVFQEQLSSIGDKRVRLDTAIEHCRKGDTLVCSTLAELAGTVTGIVAIERRLSDKGAALRVIECKIDTGGETGRWIFTIFTAIAEFEREVAVTRQREAIGKAKGEGKYKGRAPTARAKAAQALAMHKDHIGATEIAKRLKIGRRSVYRIIGDGARPLLKP